jgi:hypothetical protein
VRKRSEEISQSVLVKWSHRQDVRKLMPELAWLHHSPAGGLRDGFTGAQMTALGVKRGFPDLILPVASRADSGACGLAIEMKSATGSLAPEQKGWLGALESHGWTTHVCRSAEEARNAICSYLNVSPDSAPPLP